MPRKRKTGDGGLYYDKKRDLWVGVIDIGFNEQGKRKQKRVSSRSQSVARTKLLALQSELERHDAPLGNSTVAAWGVRWLEDYKLKKPQTYRTARSVLNVWVFPAIGRMKLKEVRPSDLNRIYASIRAAGKSSSTALKAHTVMSSMFESARLDREVGFNVANDTRPPKAAKSTRGTLDPDETQRILEGSILHRDGTKWMVSLDGGIRQGERLGATIDSVNLDRCSFTVQWNLVEGNYEHGCGGTCGKRAAGWCPDKRLVIPDGMEYRLLGGRFMLVPPKSGEARTFPISVSLRDALERHIAEISLRPNPHGLLWPGPNGQPLDGRHDQAEWKSLLRDAGVDKPNATTHWARHTAISDLAAAGVPDRTTGEIVGHKSQGVTGLYQHLTSQDAIEAMAKLEARRQLSGPTQPS